MTQWISTAATALVGMAGIGSTLWVAVSARSASGRKELTDEKRRTYTALFMQGDRVIASIKRYLALRSAGGLNAAETELEDSRIAVNSALWDLLLVAPPSVSDSAVDLYYLYLDAVNRVRSGDDDYRSAEFASARRNLLNMMRADLGRSPLTIRDAPSMAISNTRSL